MISFPSEAFRRGRFSASAIDFAIRRTVSEVLRGGGEKARKPTASGGRICYTRLMPPPYTRHVFVCTNRRPDGSPKGCCASKGGDEVRLEFKHQLDEHQVKGVRANAAGCLDACEAGVSVVVYPENVWYGGVTVADVKEIVEEHVIAGRPVERLRMQLPLVRKKG